MTERKGEDKCLILGSYGLWDAMSENTACSVTASCLRDDKSDGSGSDHVGQDRDPFLLDDHDGEELFPISKASVDATALLCRLALGRGSSTDNISVTVVDFKRH
ncbi:Protein phosphatase [Parasponia andersonii]|uniref:Protein phosphatase n=1 Tax=Parasponia andersonii TaxID=3476 RepID=A0A2P5D9K7_PARAD|nr:Protein phosphatase [Parasponia andersonii]